MLLEHTEVSNKDIEVNLSTLSRQFDILLEDAKVKSSVNMNQHFQHMETRMLEIKRAIQVATMAANGGAKRNKSCTEILQLSFFTQAHTSTVPVDLSRVEERLKHLE